MPEELKQLIRDLDADVKRLASKYRHERISSIVLAAVVALAIVYGFLYVHEATTRRKQVYSGFCFLISTTPDDPGRPFIHTYREHFGCPPYDPAKAQLELTPTPTATVTAHSTTTRTRTMPTPVLTTVPGAVRTVTGARVTVTRTQTVTRTVTRTGAPPDCLTRLKPPCVLSR